MQKKKKNTKVTMLTDRNSTILPEVHNIHRWAHSRLQNQSLKLLDFGQPKSTLLPEPTEEKEGWMSCKVSVTQQSD